jgi:hypothetical protein
MYRWSITSLSGIRQAFHPPAAAVMKGWMDITDALILSSDVVSSHITTLPPLCVTYYTYHQLFEKTATSIVFRVFDEGSCE